MGLFDSVVRSRDEAPPLKNPIVFHFGPNSRLSLLCLVSNTEVFLSIYAIMYHFGLAGYLFHVTLLAALLVLDPLSSNAFGRNVENSRKCGYSDTWTLAVMTINMLGSQAISWLFVYLSALDDPSAFSPSSFIPGLFLSPCRLFIVASNMAIAELGFTLGHSLMHTGGETLQRLHVFHHSHTQATACTNLCFHPIDLAIEFALPAVGILVSHFLLWRDGTALLATYIVFQLWYALDHDLNLGLAHLRHHARCDSLYAIYVDRPGQPKHNHLRRLMHSLDLSWPKQNSKTQ